MTREGVRDERAEGLHEAEKGVAEREEVVGKGIASFVVQGEWTVWRRTLSSGDRSSANERVTESLQESVNLREERG